MLLTHFPVSKAHLSTSIGFSETNFEKLTKQNTKNRFKFVCNLPIYSRIYNEIQKENNINVAKIADHIKAT